MDYLVKAFAYIAVFLIGWCLGVRAEKLHTEDEADLRWMHPPDDDDGIHRLEEDPDGTYQR